MCTYAAVMQWTPQEIKAHREARGLSQDQLARFVGVSRSSVVKWESAERSPDADNRRALHRVLIDGDLLDVSLRSATDLQLVAEFMRRLRSADHADLATVAWLLPGLRSDDHSDLDLITTVIDQGHADLKLVATLMSRLATRHPAGTEVVGTPEPLRWDEKDRPENRRRSGLGNDPFAGGTPSTGQ